ncbi:hypothetical protein RJ53_01260 [Methanocalculus chunghsingensis]|uniref:Uncharacterized protein n=1 Tax=Methanocalculus chunghsingensis TaxID=156457 RepID=A0A8J7W873_9EURY|nr:hypothetical protein [Methanocalculus chunghsingensis]MBR1368192.1 hypothetical protein [Methanocalculus chunghsingensis]
MSWQDITISVITFLLAAMLLPQLDDVIRRGAVVNFFTAFFTSFLAFTLTFIFATLSLWTATIGQTTVATVWLLLAYYSLRNVRDMQYPDQSVFFVARDHLGVWLMGISYVLSRFFKAFLRKG